MSYLRALGDYDDLLDVLSIDSASDPYTEWVAQVKQLGGTATILPGDSVAVDTSSSKSVYMSMLNSQSVPAARYTPSQAAGLGLVSPDAQSADGTYVYYIAPDNVVAWVAANGITSSGVALSKPAIDKATEDALPEWYKQLRTAEKAVLVLAVAGAAFYVLSFLPRGNRAAT